MNEHEDPGAGVASAEADVVELAVVAERDDATAVDAVVAHPVVPVGEGLTGGLSLGRAAKASAGVRRRSARCGRRVL